MKDNEVWEYHAEKARQDFQGNLSGLLEVHAEFLSKIGRAKASKKEVVFLELSEAEIFSGYILETVTNLMANYTIINNTNKLLNASCTSLRKLMYGNLKVSINEFKEGKISKDELAAAVTDFVNVRKSKAA